MACVTLKRPLEWVDPSMNADGGPSSPKAMMIEHSAAASRSPKRLRLQPSDPGQGGPAPNSLFKPFTAADLREQIAGELRKIKIARRNLADKSSSSSSSSTHKHRNSSSNSNHNNNTNTHNNNNNNTSDEPLFGAKSPAHSDSSMGGASPARDEFDEVSHAAPLLSQTLSTYNQFMMRRRTRTNEFGGGAAHSASSAGSSGAVSGENEPENRPMFSFNQVVMIVERLLREKEDDIRQEYDKVLVNRLAEQYEQFVKFTYDQIQRNFDSHSTPSYLS